ncbi:hypothetical protein AUJ26_02570 [Candidatus Falkowbacteria bacterium CG1_02_37_21]|nr:MAG: hypothetical protein AUJ26_02570 [Candidatus Falkowbacteria bacterium CG1_02_37_21]
MSTNFRVIKIVLTSVLSVLVIFLVTIFLIWQNNYRNRIYPGIKIGDLDLGGKTMSEASDLIAARSNEITNKGLVFNYYNRQATLAATTVSFDSDLSYSSLSFANNEMLMAAYGEEKNRGFGNFILNYLKSTKQKTIATVYTINENSVRKFLSDTFSDLNIEAVNAYFSISGDSGQKHATVSQEKIGKEINYEEALMNIKENLNNFQNVNVSIHTQSSYPTVKQDDLNKLTAMAEEIAERGSITLQSPADITSTSTKFWLIKPEQIITWVKEKKQNDKLVLALNQEKIIEYLQKNIAPEFDKDPILPRFEIKDDKVTSWQVGKNGYRINLEATAAAIKEKFLSDKKNITIVTEEVPADSLTSSNDFKIKEILGTGYSRFSGSPANRRHNIKVGADTLHGLLIKPGEDFSLMKTLGNIDASSGYKTELVIRDNKTVPEYGGGLCQIGTTMFRTALASGLPITERRNHSYRVSYYEPAGTDATIYDPAPDFRFLNDTGNYILIQARIKSDDLYFDFWGIKDGRTATTTYPVIYNIVKPEPTKIIETTDLAPGEKKCTESAHNGADAYFDYTVVYPENSTTTPLHEQRFNSHYTPWQAVCLVGAATSTSPTANTTSSESIASSTDTN